MASIEIRSHLHGLCTDVMVHQNLHKFRPLKHKFEQGESWSVPDGSADGYEVESSRQYDPVGLLGAGVSFAQWPQCLITWESASSLWCDRP